MLDTSIYWWLPLKEAEFYFPAGRSAAKWAMALCSRQSTVSLTLVARHRHAMYSSSRLQELVQRLLFRRAGGCYDHVDRPDL